MSTEQLYTLAMMQLTLVLLLAASRVRPPKNQLTSLRYLQLALFFDSFSWFLYLWPTVPLTLFSSSLASALNFWMLFLFAFSRSNKALSPLFIIPVVVVQAWVNTKLQLDGQHYQWHWMTLCTAAVTLPSAWLFLRYKPLQTTSDRVYAFVMLSWLAVCIIRSLLLLSTPESVVSGYLVSQVLWPGITAAYGIFALTGYLEETQQRLEADSELDPLTDLLNRRGLIKRASSYLAYLKRMKQDSVILMLDLDHFKAVNDRFGHDCGDQVLITVAQRLKMLLRQGDLLARWGGEEFLIFLPNTDSQQAQLIANRICHEIEAINWRELGLEHLTTSIGIATISECMGFEQTIKAADAALYQAKQQGRNQAILHISA